MTGCVLARNPCEVRPIRGFLRKVAVSWSAWAEAHPTHCRRRTGPVVAAAPSGSRFRPLVPGSSRVFRARCSCAREPCGWDGRPRATAPGTHEPPWAHAPEPPLLLLSPHRLSPRCSTHLGAATPSTPKAACEGDSSLWANSMVARERPTRRSAVVGRFRSAGGRGPRESRERGRDPPCPHRAIGIKR